jgi:hypothetical protein
MTRRLFPPALLLATLYLCAGVALAAVSGAEATRIAEYLRPPNRTELHAQNL